MKPTLQLRLGQQLKLTPQLRQAIRLLQLSQTELEAEINLALESNPMLERIEDQPASLESDSTGQSASTHADLAADHAADHDSDYGVDSAQASDHAADHDASALAEPSIEHATDQEIDSDWGDRLPTTASGAADPDTLEQRDPGGDSLHDHLLWQLHLSTMSARDRQIGAAIIDAVNDHGQLGETLETIQQTLKADFRASLDEMDVVLHRIQRFDPLGVAARNLAECLGIQLSALDDSTPGLLLAQRIAREHLEDLARLGVDKLGKILRQPASTVSNAVELLRSLDPRPGAQFSAEPVEYVTPDAYVSRREGVWQVYLGAGARPQLGISRLYEGLIGAASRDDASYLRGQLQEARWLLRSLETRADTVLRVATAIVRHQSGYLEFGAEAMRPLTLRTIADELELHESTISRVTTRKYLHTPRGVFEFKHFFSSSLGNANGDSTSGTAIQAKLKRLIDQENPRKPLSDAKLVSLLKTEGVTVARRTVAKYREAMNIPSSNERQRLG